MLGGRCLLMCNFSKNIGTAKTQVFIGLQEIILPEHINTSMFSAWDKCVYLSWLAGTIIIAKIGANSSLLLINKAFSTFLIDFSFIDFDLIFIIFFNKMSLVHFNWGC